MRKGLNTYLSGANTLLWCVTRQGTIGIRIHEANRFELTSLEVLTQSLSSFRPCIAIDLRRLRLCLLRNKSLIVFKNPLVNHYFRSCREVAHHQGLYSLKSDLNVAFSFDLGQTCLCYCRVKLGHNLLMTSPPTVAASSTTSQCETHYSCQSGTKSDYTICVSPS